MTHPTTRATARITLPANVIVCPCGSHHMVRGQRVHPARCEQLQMGDRR